MGYNLTWLRDYTEGGAIGDKVNSPPVTFGGITNNSFIVLWDKVPNATIYVVKINGSEFYRGSGDNYRAANLLPNTDYSISVTAIGEANFKDSDPTVENAHTTGGGGGSTPLLFNTPLLTNTQLN